MQNSPSSPAAATDSAALRASTGRVPSPAQAASTSQMTYLSQQWTHGLSDMQRACFRALASQMGYTRKAGSAGKSLFISLSAARMQIDSGILTDCPAFPDPLVPLPAGITLTATLSSSGSFSLVVDSPSPYALPVVCRACRVQPSGAYIVRDSQMCILETLVGFNAPFDVAAAYLRRFTPPQLGGWICVTLMPVTPNGFQGPLVPLRATVESA